MYISLFQRSPICLGTGYARVKWEMVRDTAGEFKEWGGVYMCHTMKGS